MSVAYGSSTAIQGNVGSTTAALSLPSGISAGNILIAWIQFPDFDSYTAFAATGWTLGDSYGTTNGSGAWLWRIATGADSITVTWDGTSTAWHAAVHRFTGTHQSTPIGNTNNASDDGSHSPITCAALTAQEDGNMIVAFLVIDNDSETISIPTDYTSILEYHDFKGSNRNVYQAMPTAGPSTAISVTYSNPQYWHSMGLELRGPVLSLKFAADFVDDDSTFTAAITLIPVLHLSADFMDDDSAFTAAITLTVPDLPPVPELPPSIPPVSVIVINR